MTLDRSGRKKHFVVLDGLRGVAALFVVLLHLSETFVTGIDLPCAHLAVDFFFMLSGFVIAYSYDERLKGQMSFSQFAAVRLVRLYPMVFLGVCFGLVSRVLDGAGGFGISALLGATVFALLMMPLPRFSGSPTNAFPINGPLWSITFELISNFVYAASIKYLSNRVLFLLTIAMSVGLVIVSYYLDGISVGVVWQPALVFALLRVLCPFGIGVLLFRFVDYRHEISPLYQLLALFGLVGVLSAQFLSGRWYDPLVILCIFPAVILVAAKSSCGGIVKAVWSYLGWLSYPIYALNQPLFRILKWMTGMELFSFGSVIGVVLAFCIAIGVTMLVSTYYDDPIRATLGTLLPKRRSRQSIAIANR